MFKTGPDFLDPMVLERAAGSPVHQLDLWMCGEAECRRLLHRAAAEADLVLVEGVMGLFDGAPSGADLAALFDIPVLAVIDASAMAQTFGALALGLASYRADIRLAGVLANQVAGARHADMLRESLPDGLRWAGACFRNADIQLPERHLGLVQADEVSDIERRIELAADDLPDEARALPAAVGFPPPEGAPALPSLHGVRIGVARDAAFSFIYPANLDLLEAAGARLEFFSPLADARLPEVDAIWLPGGYPELHLAPLAGNRAMLAALRAHHAAGKPLLAECGGMLYLAESLADAEGECAELAGLLPGRAAMQKRLAALGLQAVDLPEGRLRGHTFHFSRIESALAPLATAENPNGGAGEAVYRQGRLTASYVHFYFPSNPAAAAGLFLP